MDYVRTCIYAYLSEFVGFVFGSLSDLWGCAMVSLSQHIVTCHGSTLLPQFLGMYRVSVESEDTYIIVMRNMFSHRLVVHTKYDLKVRQEGAYLYSVHQGSPTTVV